VLSGVPPTVGRAEALWIVDPGTAANDAVGACSRYLRRTIGGRPGVAIVITILYPVVDVAMHLVEAPGIRLK
jgi:hypothetical protein